MNKEELLYQINNENNPELKWFYINCYLKEYQTLYRLFGQCDSIDIKYLTDKLYLFDNNAIKLNVSFLNDHHRGIDDLYKKEDFIRHLNTIYHKEYGKFYNIYFKDMDDLTIYYNNDVSLSNDITR
jgi:hypothetical protein